MCSCVIWSKIAVLAAAGRDGIDGDVVAGELLAERLGQRDHAGLGGRVVGGVGVAFLAGDRGDVDDAPVVLRDHAGHDRARADEGAVEVDAHHLAPFLDLGLPGLGVDAGDAGVVDEDIDASEALDGGVAGLGDRGGLRHVAGDRVDRSPSALAVFCASAMSRSQIATRAPEATKRSAMALPKPWAPPVTTAVRPSRSMTFDMCGFSDVEDRGFGDLAITNGEAR